MAEKLRFPWQTPLSHTKVGVGSGQNPGFRAEEVWDAAHTTSDCGTGGLLELWDWGSAGGVLFQLTKVGC